MTHAVPQLRAKRTHLFRTFDIAGKKDKAKGLAAAKKLPFPL